MNAAQRLQRIEWFERLTRVALMGHEAAAFIGRVAEQVRERPALERAIVALARAFDDSQQMLRDVLHEYGNALEVLGETERDLQAAQTSNDTLRTAIDALRAQKGGN